MKDIGVGSVLIRTQHFNEITPKNSAFIVESMSGTGEVTMLKLKGIPYREFCLDNFKLSKNRKRDLKRAYQYLIDRCKYQIKMYKEEMKRELAPVNETKFLFTKQDLIDSGLNIK